MAFVDLKTERADYRIIGTCHAYKVDHTQLSSGVSAVMVESIATDPIVLHRFLARDTTHHYGEIFAQCYDQRIPIVHALPVATEKSIRCNEYDPFLLTFDQRAEIQKVYAFASAPFNLTYPSYLFDGITAFVDTFTLGGKEAVKLFSLLLAQRAAFFANYQSLILEKTLK
jgi:hypothetical protein